MDDLHKQAEELGIDVDNRWSDETLQAKIDEALAKPKEAAKPAKAPKEPKTKEEKLFPVKLLKHYRPVKGFKIVDESETRDPNDYEAQKVPAGKVILLDVEEAKTVIAKKIAERADAIG